MMTVEETSSDHHGDYNGCKDGIALPQILTRSDSGVGCDHQGTSSSIRSSCDLAEQRTHNEQQQQASPTQPRTSSLRPTVHIQDRSSAVRHPAQYYGHQRTWYDPACWPPPRQLRRYNFLSTLFASLILSTALALLSALDATVHCTRGTAAWKSFDFYDYDGDEAEGKSCRDLFVTVLLPVCPLVILVSFRACRLLTSHHSSLQSNDGAYTNGICLERNEALLQHQRLRLQSYYSLFRSAIVVLAAWTYCIVAIMLRHEQQDSQEEDDDPFYTKDDDVTEEDGAVKLLSPVPFQSLAAVNPVGHVGQNANLYYTSWISLGLSVALAYELAGMTLEQHKLVRKGSSTIEERTAIEIALDWSASRMLAHHEARSTWYMSLYRLRFRTGIWLAALLATSVLLASSLRVWKYTIDPAKQQPPSDDGDDAQLPYTVCATIQDHSSYDMNISPTMCRRTSLSILTGIAGMILTFLALMSHTVIRRRMAKIVEWNAESHEIRKLFPLTAELLAAIILTVWFGANAVMATSVDGPAPSVGNLYYSTWICFLLTLRVAMGCVEEALNRDEVEEQAAALGVKKPFLNDSTTRSTTATTTTCRKNSSSSDFQMRKEIATKVVMLSDSYAMTPSQSDFSRAQSFSPTSPEKKMQNVSHLMPLTPETEDDSYHRPKRLRRYGSVSIFSTVYALSAADAHFHLTGDAETTVPQRYMMTCPILLAIVCGLMFIMCLATSSYAIVDSFLFGGVVSITIFLLWLSTLIVTMQAESSWAVDEIGDIVIANLYYCAWCSIITSGLQMSSYVKKFLGLKPKGIIAILWFAIAKVCFVIFGSSTHILLNVQGECNAASSNDEAHVTTFCWRTKVAFSLGVFGMVTGFLAMIARAIDPYPGRMKLRAEVLFSLGMVGLFAVCTELITGIGGPGQSVGDLYYASWVGFIVSMIVSGSCYEDLQRLHMEQSYIANQDASENGNGVII